MLPSPIPYHLSRPSLTLLQGALPVHGSSTTTSPPKAKATMDPKQEETPAEELERGALRQRKINKCVMHCL